MWPSYLGALFANCDTVSRAPEVIRLPDDDTRSITEAIRQHDNSTTYRLYSCMPESAVLDTRFDDMPVIHDRYWNRQFPKNYAKSRKAKTRQQRQARKHNR